ncbi:CDP-2,3-bis-(O-geranylgeranyl)-sn-glycerol synthase, partial [Candidatus Bathyarchaeota archaeon]
LGPNIGLPSRKTIRGFFSGVLVGTITGLLLGLLGLLTPLLPDSLVLGFLMGLGAMLGDLAGSFLKRRLNRPPGAPAPGLDQLDFLLGAILLSFPYRPPALDVLACALVLTPAVHLATNFGAYKLGLKKEPW